MKRPPSSPTLTIADLLTGKREVLWNDLEGAGRVVLTYSGRAATYQYLSWLRRSGNLPAERQVVLVPAFHCPNVVDPVLHAGFQVRFYAIDEGLQVVNQDFLAKLDGKVAVALFIEYFGFPGMPPILVSACRQAGAKVLEDCSHSFLYANPTRIAGAGADATTFSFYKLLPGRAGGGLAACEGQAGALSTQLTRPQFGDSVARCKALLREVLDDKLERLASRFGGDSAAGQVVNDAVPAVRRSAAEAYPYHAEASSWKMPAISRHLLRNADLDALCTARRRNYDVFAKDLVPTEGMWPVFGELPGNVCPWGFPLVLKNRGDHDYLIRAKGVPLFTFGEVLHPLLFETHATQRSMLDWARFLSDNLLVLSVHQGLRLSQVRQFAQIVNASTSVVCGNV